LKLRKKPLGCLSFTGLMAVLLTLLLLAGLGMARGGEMFSPGELNAQAGGRTLGGVQSHAGTGGQCVTCHSAPWQAQTLAENCLACHTELTIDPQNFHSVMLAQSQSQGCTGCHTDHRGSDAALTSLDLADFPHLSVGFSLQAHHKTAQGVDFTCVNCHTSDLSQFDPKTCAGCHAQIDPAYIQEHTLAFGLECLTCHDGADRYGGSFDHNLLKFQLTGRHSEVSCAECHAGARSVIDLQSAPQDCFDCHAQDDAHQGKFGQDCVVCHSPEDWEQASFDHARATFQLTGAHVNVECSGCHVNNVFKGTPQDCVGCHADPEFHAGLFPTECAACHTTAAWSPAQFNQAHTFPINHGEGGPSTCKTCHSERLNAYTCYGCHEHNPAEIAAKHREEGISDFTDCMSCHPSGQGEEGGD
jgi:hypothetical protein